MAHRMSAQRVAVGGHDLFVSDCWKCGTVFGMPRYIEEARRKDGQPMYCPLGHAGCFSTEKSLDQRRIEELERDVAAAQQRAESAQRAREWAESQTKGANIAAGKAKAAHRRVIERVHAGVCPHCNRTFKQLAAHMKAKHAERVKR